MSIQQKGFVIGNQFIPIQNSITDTTSSTITIDKTQPNTTYHFGTITSLTITSVTVSDYQTNIFFTAGNSITVNLPASLKIMGNMQFLANTQYVISILNNVAISGEFV